MLEVHNLSVAYGQHRALEDVSVRVSPGEIVVILGANGAGKSTLLKTISGICEGQHSGSVSIGGQQVAGLAPDSIVEHGIALVPEGRGVFGDLSVKENLLLGAYANRARDDESSNLQRVLSLFPKLVERQGQAVRTMSGGEQQMVAVGRALMSNPQILMLDEPSLGLSPILCKELFQLLKEIRETGIGILLVEQNAKQSLAIADRGYLLENAHIVHEDTAERLTNDPAVQQAYLGTGSSGKTSAGKASPAVAALAPALSSGTAPVPATPLVSSVAAPRQSAEQLLGQSLDTLVASASASASASAAAAATSSHSVGGHQQDTGRNTSLSTGSQAAAVSARSAVGDGSHEKRLKYTLQEIEESARHARQRAAQRPRSVVRTVTKPIDKPDSAPSSKPAKPVVIEVYRAPRVEVYRRRSGSNEFIRD